MDYTLILNYFNKSAEHMVRHFKHCLNQTLKPKHIFVCFLGLPKEKSFMIQAFKELFGNLDNVYIVESNFNFKYIGRYQIALGAPDDYVVMLDDDRFPMPNYCKRMIEVISQEECLVQQSGWVLNTSNNKVHKFGRPADKIRYTVKGVADMGGTFLDASESINKTDRDRLFNADYLCGGIVFRRDSLKYLFSQPFPTRTGEDIAFCFRAKQNNIPVYILLPDINKEEDSWLHDSNGVNFTANDIDTLIYRTKLIRSELNLPFSDDDVNIFEK